MCDFGWLELTVRQVYRKINKHARKQASMQVSGGSKLNMLIGLRI